MIKTGYVHKSLVAVILLITMSLFYSACFYNAGPDGEFPDEFEEKVEAPLPNGYIQGKLGFPSEPFPKYMKVFAYNLETGKQYSIQSYGELTYKLEVPPGMYHVYAYLDTMPEYWAYYNEYVVNGMQPGSERGCPIIVEVFPGEVTVGVDPLDWDHYIDDRFYERHG